MICSQRPWIDMVITERTAEANLILFALNDMLLMVSKSSYTVEKALVEGRKEIGWLLEETSQVRQKRVRTSWTRQAEEEIRPTCPQAPVYML